MTLLLFPTIASALAYFYFNWRYFRLVTGVLRLPRMAKLPVVAFFLVNYAMFFVCTVLSFDLVVNWALFFVFLLAETVPYCKRDWRAALFFSMNGILYGLCVNIFCRCAVSIATARPLMAFDNNVGSWKAMPVFFGFLLGGLVLHLASAPKVREQFRLLLAHPGHLLFQLEIIAVMFLYLFLNLLLYQSPGNFTLLKLWGLKSCVFSVTGAYFGMRYSLKMCRLSDYRKQNRSIRQKLVQTVREEQELRTTANRDALTGAASRPYILGRLERLLRLETPFVLCFLDLDDLKGVNDLHGHKAGDRYLVAVARELEAACRKGWDLLSRYGGDEFLLLFPEVGPTAVEDRILQVDRRLQELSRSGSVPFPMSVSYGVVPASAAPDAEGLIAAADRKMYAMKQEKKKASPPSSAG